MNDLHRSKVLSCGHEVLEETQCHYCTYIQSDLLDELARPKDSQGEIRTFSHPDEFQFILIHQSCELSFKGYLYELHRGVACIDNDDFEGAANFIDRCRSWILIAARQLQHLVDHLTPKDFAFFRDFLSPASGAESIRFRLIELSTGIKADGPYVGHRGRTFTFREFLDREPAEGTGRPKTRWWTQSMSDIKPHSTLRGALISALARHQFSSLASLDLIDSEISHCRDLLMGDTQLSHFAQTLVRLEKAILAVRKVHLNAARKHISENSGTGDTDGVAYLRSVMDTARCFPALTEAFEQLEREGQFP